MAPWSSDEPAASTGHLAWLRGNHGGPEASEGLRFGFSPDSMISTDARATFGKSFLFIK